MCLIDTSFPDTVASYECYECFVFKPPPPPPPPYYAFIANIYFFPQRFVIEFHSAFRAWGIFWIPVSFLTVSARQLGGKSKLLPPPPLRHKPHLRFKCIINKRINSNTRSFFWPNMKWKDTFDVKNNVQDSKILCNVRDIKVPNK